MLRVDLRIDYDMRAAIASDDVADAIDYKQVASCVRELLIAREWRLIEKLAFDIAVSVRGLHATISSVEVGVTKDVIADVASVAAFIVLDH
jgi:dihydroneopterin aldolase